VIYHYVPSQQSDDSHYQLYNLKADPFEQHNLADGKPDELARMMRGLVAALENHQALYPMDKDGKTTLKP
jgi:arylsulfatase A-like enzyme